MQVKKLSSSEREAYLRLVLDSTSEGFYSVESDGTTTLCNAAFLKMLGYSSEDEVLGRKIHDEIHHTHPDGTKYHVDDCPIYQAASQGKSSYIPYEIFYRRDGSSFSVEYRAEPLYVAGKLKGAICTFVDITKREVEKNASRETEERYTTLFNSVDEGFCIIQMLYNDQGKPDNYLFLEVNPAFEVMTGLKNVQGKTIASLVDGHEEYWYEIYDKVAKTGEAVRFTNRAKALDKWYDVYATKFGKHDNQVAVLFDDITERRATDAALSESRNHLSLMVESAKDFAIISLNVEGDIVSWNEGAVKIFGFDSKEMVGKNLEAIFTPEDREHKAPEYELTTATEKGRAIDERWHLKKNGERFYASGTLASMHDSDGKLNGFVKIARDMTSEKEAQQKLIEARNEAEAANLAKTEFLANMSHEIRTPMNAVIGLSNILAISKPLTDKQKEFIKTLQMSADSLLSLINDLLDIAKIEARTVELEHVSFSVTQVIQEVMSMIGGRISQKNLKFTTDAACVEHRVFMGDPTRLRQIILNLFSNAVKFTETGGVDISISCQPTGDVKTENISIAVKDSGIGIEANKLETIFHKFTQADSSINRKYGGTGLGLAITKTLTEIMSGTIKVESIINKGSTFTVTLPLEIADDEKVQESSGSTQEIINSSVGSKPKPRILLVEDYAANVMVATIFLEEFGYEVEVANNGLEAFNMIKEKQYIAALMDVQMHGMNGFESTQLIREYEKKNGSRKIHIIGMTAHALAGDRERCIAVGMDDYIAKPFNPNELKEKLALVMQR